MRRNPYETSAPANSLIINHLADADFHDAWSIRSNDVERCALGHFIAATAKTPGWINACMNLRNRAVALVGLKDLGQLSALTPNKPASSYQPGDRVGIFTLFENRFDEALLGDKDRHLDVLLSVHRRPLPADGQVEITVTTVVHIHNMLGRFYMLPVKPMHRLIAPAVLATIGTRSSAQTV